MFWVGRDLKDHVVPAPLPWCLIPKYRADGVLWTTPVNPMTDVNRSPERENKTWMFTLYINFKKFFSPSTLWIMKGLILASAEKQWRVSGHFLGGGMRHSSACHCPEHLSALSHVSGRKEKYCPLLLLVTQLPCPCLVSDTADIFCS